MKITRRQLKKIIKEELQQVLQEQFGTGSMGARVAQDVPSRGTRVTGGTLERAGRAADSYFSGETGGLTMGDWELGRSPYGDPATDPRLAPTPVGPRGGPIGMLPPEERKLIQRHRSGAPALADPAATTSWGQPIGPVDSLSPNDAMRLKRFKNQYRIEDESGYIG
tara:strand:+ start:356 stop:853 length:498 start_codon:yes stop_codon:yes gene_type:complete